MSQQNVIDNQTLERISIEDVKKIVEAGLWAPSGDNCQPWHFTWDGTSIQINLLTERSIAYLDVNNFATLSALGATLTNMHIAAQELGYGLTLDLFPEAENKKIMARIGFKSIIKTEHPLFPSLRSRSTHRGKYAKEPLPSALRSALMFTANGVPGVSLDLVEDRPLLTRLANLAARFDRNFFTNRPIHDCLYRWLRWTPAQTKKTRDGLPIETLELGLLDQWGLKMAEKWGVAHFLSKLKADEKAVRQTEKLYQASGAIGLLTIDGSAPEDFVMAGMVLERLWLTAAKAGYSLQPTVGVVGLELRYRFNRESLTEKETEEIEQLRREIGNINLPFTQRVPVFMFRIGKAINPPHGRTLRRNLVDVFTWEERKR